MLGYILVQSNVNKVITATCINTDKPNEDNIHHQKEIVEDFTQYDSIYMKFKIYSMWVCVYVCEKKARK